VRHVYIYYRIDPAQASAAARAIDALLAQLVPHCAHPPRRMHRCNDPTTWMEIYAGIANFPVFAAALSESVQALNCTSFIQGERHLECFAPSPPYTVSHS
jgi:hypothetical protein